MISRLFLPLLAALSATALAEPMDVATSPKGSTASSMFADLGKVCLNAAPLRQRQTSGSDENLDLLLGNQVAMAFVQLDVLKAREQIDGDTRVTAIKTLLPLNFDELHLLAPPPSSRRNMLGKVTVTGVTRFSELSGKRLGAWGGSLTTAKVLAAKSGVNVTVTPFPDRDAALSALSRGAVDAVLAVTGQPADWVKALDPARIRLLPIDIDPAALKGFYQNATLQYGPLGAGIRTYSVQRLLVTRDFKTPARRAELAKYATCARKNLVRLQETQGFHPKWNDVTFAPSSWPAFKP